MFGYTWRALVSNSTQEVLERLCLTRSCHPKSHRIVPSAFEPFHLVHSLVRRASSALHPEPEGKIKAKYRSNIMTQYYDKIKIYLTIYFKNSLIIHKDKTKELQHACRFRKISSWILRLTQRQSSKF